MLNKKFKTGNSEIDQHILELSKLFPPSEDHEVLRLEILTTVAKFFLEHKDLGDYKSDTEMLLEQNTEKGTEFIKDLEGEFTFIIFD